MDRCPLWTLVALLSLACLEPNPHFVSDGGESGTDGSTAETSADTTTDTDSGCDPCELAFEVVEFDADADGASGTVPKPDLPHTVALALIDEYAPGNADGLGYAIEWTDDGSAWRFDVTLADAANNSRVRGRAIVLGFADPPSEAELRVDTNGDGCRDANIDTNLIIVDTVERYDPDGDDELSYARSSPAADAIEYCITEASSNGAEIRVKLVGFTPPAGITAEQVDEVLLASAVPQSSSFPQIDGAEILHLLSARGFDEGAATDLGYAINCNDSAAPWGCSFDLPGFRDGVEVVVGGAIVAIP